ncbi:MAG: hypothetical protein U0167_00485 [bacterium]
MNLAFLALLRTIHVLAGAFWVGAAFLNAVFLIPSIMAAGPAGSQVMRGLVQVRRLPVFMNAVMAFTLLSGIGLYWRVSGFRLSWITSTGGLTLTFGALCAIATAGIGHSVTVPTVRKLGQLGAEVAAAGGKPSPAQAADIDTLQRRLLRAAQVGSALVVVATIAMALSRYV